jgi:hypothetical protein
MNRCELTGTINPLGCLRWSAERNSHLTLARVPDPVSMRGAPIDSDPVGAFASETLRVDVLPLRIPQLTMKSRGSTVARGSSLMLTCREGAPNHHQRCASPPCHLGDSKVAARPRLDTKCDDREARGAWRRERQRAAPFRVGQRYREFRMRRSLCIGLSAAPVGRPHQSCTLVDLRNRLCAIARPTRVHPPCRRVPATSR